MVGTRRNNITATGKRLGGFTFIELLATVVLIAVIMPVAMRSIGLCTRLGGLSRRQIEAASLAKMKMTELAVTGEWENGNQHGNFGEDWPGYEWKVAVTNWTEAGDAEALCAGRDGTGERRGGAGIGNGEAG